MAIGNMTRRKWYTATTARGLMWHASVEEVLLEIVVFATGQVFRLSYLAEGGSATGARVFVLQHGSGMWGRAVSARGLSPQYFERNLLELYQKLIQDVGVGVKWTDEALQTGTVEWLESLDPKRWFGDFAIYNNPDWSW